MSGRTRPFTNQLLTVILGYFYCLGNGTYLPAGFLGQAPAELLLRLPPEVLLRDQLQRAAWVDVRQAPIRAAD
jgi:hypothetical protein